MNRRFIVFFSSILMSFLALAEDSTVFVVSDIYGGDNNYRTTLNNVSKNAINGLTGYTASDINISEEFYKEENLDESTTNSNKRKQKNSQGLLSLKLPKIAEYANSNGINLVAIQELEILKRKKARNSITFYKSDTLTPVLKSVIELEFENYRALVAQLEYLLIRDLKKELHQIGSLIKKDAGYVYFDIGHNAKVQVGDLYRVYTIGDEIVSKEGESYGFLDYQTGIVEVVEVTSIYSKARILLGQQSIKARQFVEKSDGVKEDFQGKVVSKFENNVAINIGQNAGVTEGAYFAVYKEQEKVNEDRSFKQLIGKIRITEVDPDVSVGVVARSNSYDLSKELIQVGSSVIEVNAESKNLITLGQIIPSSTNADSNYFIGWQGESDVSTSLFYRARAGMSSSGNVFGSLGAMSAINNSDSDYYGIDLIYSGGVSTNLFLSMDIETPIDHLLKLNTELGYVVGNDNDLSGLNIQIGVKFNLPN